MTPKDTYTLRYFRDEDGWGFEIESYSGKQRSWGYPTREMAKKATPDLLRAMRLKGKHIHRKKE